MVAKAPLSPDIFWQAVIARNGEYNGLTPYASLMVLDIERERDDTEKDKN